MRPSHEPWTSTLDLPMTALKDRTGKTKQQSRPPPIHLAASARAFRRARVRQGQASGGATAPSLTDRCARRFTVGPPPCAFGGGAELCPARDFGRALNRPALRRRPEKKEKKSAAPLTRGRSYKRFRPVALSVGQP